MMPKRKPEDDSLRKTAEEFIKEGKAKLVNPDATDMERLLHELSVHQVELETQNENLRQAQRQAEEAREHYSLLFHDAPVAYFVLDGDGAIKEVNGEGQRLIGLRARQLVGTRLRTYLSADSLVTFRLHLEAVLATKERQRCEVVLTNLPTKEPVNVLVESVSLSSASGSNRVRSAFIDLTERRRVEAALQRSEATFRSVVENSHDGILLCDAKGVILYSSPSYTRMNGYADVERVGHNRFETAHPDDLEELRRYWKHVLQHPGIPLTAEYRIRHKNGTWIWLETTSQNQLDNQHIQAVVVAARDITERKKAEEALRTSRLQLMGAADMARIAYWEHDQETDELIFNDGFYDLYGTTAEGEGGYRMAPEEYLRRFVHPDDLEALRREVEENRVRPRAEINKTHEHRVLRRDGEVIHILSRNRAIFDPEGRVLNIIGVNQDITERRKMEDALRESETKLRAIFDNSRDAIAAAKNGIHVFVNPAFVSLFGYESADEIIGTPAIDLVAPESRGLLRERLRKRAAGESLPSLHELTVLRKDGARLLVESMVSSYTVKGDQFTLVIARDISEKKTLEAQLRQAQKLEAVGTLTGGIAHDFNNILAVIIGFTEMAKEDLPPDSPVQEGLGMALESALRGRHLIKQMLAFTRQTDQEKRPISLAGIVREAATFLRASIPATIDIQTSLGNESDSILGDPVQLQQVVINLSTNAAYAMRVTGGTLTLELAEFSASDGDSHGMASGSYVTLAVRDTGEGISPDNVDKIFDPFFTTKRPGEGTGLGLSVVHGIVTAHGGYLTVESKRGRGAVFTVYLPKVGDEAPKEATMEEALPGGHERILFVDDEVSLSRVGRKILEGLGYRVSSTTSSAEALALFTEDPASFDLVITDQTMPEMTGIELARELLNLRSDMPIILCTGYSYLVDAETARAAGISAFAMKPLTKGEIARTVRRVLDGKPGSTFDR